LPSGPATPLRHSVSTFAGSVGVLPFERPHLPSAVSQTPARHTVVAFEGVQGPSPFG
jgi:hypothetical protein